MAVSAGAAPSQIDGPVGELVRAMFTPLRTHPTEQAAAVLATADIDEWAVDGTRVIGYVLRGAPGGSPAARRAPDVPAVHERRVLLVHGWSGNAGQLAALAAAVVRTGRTAVVLDQPGHGRSEGEFSSVIHFARAIQAAQDRCGAFETVVAHSLGSAAVSYALGVGSLRCHTVVYVNPMTSYASLWQRNIAAFGIAPELMSAAVHAAERWLQISFDEIAPLALAPKMDARLLVIHDRHDRESALADSAALTASWPGARLTEVVGLGHTRVLGNPEIVTAIIDFATAADRA